MTTIREWLSHLRNKTKQSVEKTKAETQKTYNKILDTEIDEIKSKSKSTLKNIDEKLVDASETFKSDVSKTSKKIGKFVYKFLKYSLILIVIGGFLFTLPSIISSFKDEIVPYLQNYTKAKYIENSDIMQFEGSTIHPYVFYYIHRNLEPRLISEVEIGEQIDLKKFYKDNQSLVNNLKTSNTYKLETNFYVTYSPIAEVRENVFLVNIYFMTGCGMSICVDTRGYYLFELNDSILKIGDHYLTGTVHPGDIKFYKIENNKVLLKVEGYAVDDKKIELIFK